MRKQSVGKMWKTKEWKECEKFTWKTFGKKCGKKVTSKKAWINDLEEVKSVEKCQCGKKREKIPWKNITYLVVAVLLFSTYLSPCATADWKLWTRLSCLPNCFAGNPTWNCSLLTSSSNMDVSGVSKFSFSAGACIA
jgi:hypothetical protein